MKSSHGTTWIVMGSSGSGKGTQVRLLSEYLEKQADGSVIVLGMGDLFRDFWKQEGYINDLSKRIVEKGGLQPSFLQIYLWANFLLEKVGSDDHLIIDGSPRRLEDAKAMPGAFSFLGRDKINFVFLEIGLEVAKERLMSRETNNDALRALEDADLKRIQARLDWFREHSMPAIEFFRNNEYTDFLAVDGEQDIETIHRTIINNYFES